MPLVSSRHAASGRPLLTLPPAAEVLGLNGELSSQGPEGPQAWAGKVSPSVLRFPRRALRGLLIIIIIIITIINY